MSLTAQSGSLWAATVVSGKTPAKCLNGVKTDGSTMFKERLLTPGPTTIPQRVLQAMELPMLHHRSEVFKKELTKACEGMRWLLGWDSDPIFLAASGTGAMEASLLNTCSPGDEVITVNGGSFGARWRSIAERLGLVARELIIEWGSPAAIEQVRGIVESHPNARAFCIQHSETSTTVLHPLEILLKEVKRLAPEMLTIVDGISACVTTPMPGDSSTIDIYIAGSQKAFMLPPGLSMVALSERGWNVVETTPKRSLYFDLALERKALRNSETSWTPASTIIVGLNAAIEIFREEGLDQIYARHRQLSTIAREGLQSLGCCLLAADAPCPSVTGFFPPQNIDADTLRSEVRKRFGIRLAGGQGKFAGKIVRVGHMGFVDPFDVMNAVTAIGATINRIGGTADTTTAVKACLHHIAL
jgi:aspartate aminotransferase-like enzyme